MAHPTESDGRKLARERRRARLAAELRSNLRKRKEQARSRSLHDAPAREGDGREDQPSREAATKPKGEIA